MKPIALMLLFAILPFQGVMAETRSLISGDDPAEVQENAFKRGMDYPVGPLKCSQRCSQWWGAE